MIDSHIQDETKQQKDDQKELTLKGRYVITRGLKVFGYNPINNELYELKPYDIEEVEVYSKPDGTIAHNFHEKAKAKITEGLIYFEALNKRNAEKRLLKWKLGKLKYLENIREFKGITL